MQNKVRKDIAWAALAAGTVILGVGLFTAFGPVGLAAAIGLILVEVFLWGRQRA